MFAARPIHLVACLAACALAMAGCAGTSTTGAGGQPLQSLAGGGDEQSQTMTVLVNDFEFSPDVEVVDREFDAKLSAKLGGAVGHDAIKTITFKRVADEIGATSSPSCMKRPVSRMHFGGEGYPAEGHHAVDYGVDNDKSRHSEQNLSSATGGGRNADVPVAGSVEPPTEIIST